MYRPLDASLNLCNVCTTFRKFAKFGASASRPMLFGLQHEAELQQAVQSTKSLKVAAAATPILP